MRDPRRTPVRVIDLSPDTASFRVKVLDFEDTGAEWSFPIWQADKFLCDANAARLDTATLTQLNAAARMLNRPLSIPAHSQARQETETALASETGRALRWLTAQGITSHDTTKPLTAFAAFSEPTTLTQWLSENGVADLDARFARTYVSNPHAGEFIKAHRMALAELGLCPFHGKQLRDTTELAGPHAMPRRKAHIFARLSFLRACFEILKTPHVALFRTIYSDSPLTPPRATGFVSATFDRAVAERFLSAAKTSRHKALLSQNVPVSRLFMTHLETPALRTPYDEAEALLICDPTNAIF